MSPEIGFGHSLEQPIANESRHGLASLIVLDQLERRMDSTFVKFWNDYIRNPETDGDPEITRTGLDGVERRFNKKVLSGYSPEGIWHIRRSDDGHYLVALADILAKEITEPTVLSSAEWEGGADISLKHHNTPYTLELRPDSTLIHYGQTDRRVPLKPIETLVTQIDARWQQITAPGKQAVSEQAAA